MKFIFSMVNWAVVWIAASPLHRLLMNRVVVLVFKGRKSGRAYRIPVSYLDGGEEIWCMTARSGVWWKNLVGEIPCEVLLGGRLQPCVADVEASDSKQIQQALSQFCEQSRASAFFAGVGFSAGEVNQNDLEAASLHQVLIRLRRASAWGRD